MTPAIMAILNITSDSFFIDSRYSNLELAVAKGIEFAKAGAHILDIGGESTRPGATSISEEEELRRTIPVISRLKQSVSATLSIDTTKPQVALKAIEEGASFINDITGFHHPQMVEIASSYPVDLCVMHMQGSPQTMQNNPSYPEGIIVHLLHWFEERLNRLSQAGIPTSRIILDPGIGFGKNVVDNLILIKNIATFKRFGCRLLVGLSRKSFMGKILNKPSTQLLSTTLALNTMVLLEGVDIIRVHDVPEHHDVLTLLSHMNI